MRKREPVFIPEIKERRAFQVNNNIYRTPSAAAKKIAWAWIFLKYGDIGDMQNIGKIREIKCTCTWYIDEVEGRYPHEVGCPIHDRYLGYFRKLHQRIVTHILWVWELT